MPEQQNIEYKQGWHDDYLKWICGFAMHKEKGKISNADYQELFSVSKATATRDLTELLDKFGLLEKVGQTGAGTFYILKN